MAAKRQSNKGKSKSSAKPSYTPLLDAENLADAAPSGSSYNADLLTAGFNTLAKLREELWPGVADEMPLGIGAGGQQAAFDANQCKASLFGKDDASTVKYRCAQSIFRFDTLFNADPSVPLRQASINDLGKRFYELPAPYNGTLTIAVPPDWLEQSCDVLKAKPVSPCENILAFVLSIYRDIDDEEKLAQWRQHALSVNVEYVIANSDEQIYFLNTNLRQDLVAKKDALTHTTLQKIFSVLNCKSRMEKISGPLSTEAFCQRFAKHYQPASKDEEVTDAFVDTCITLSKRVLNQPGLMDLLLRADEERGGDNPNPFDSWTKLQVIVSKTRNPKATEWVLHSMFDGWKNKYITSDQMTWRALRESLHGKGTVDFLTGLFDFRDYLFSKVVTSYEWPSDVVSTMKEVSALHDVYRSKNGNADDVDVDLTWRAGWPKSAEMFWSFLEDALFADTFQSAFKNLVRHRKPVADWADNPEVSSRLDAVKAQWDKEEKKRKKEAGEKDEEPIAVDEGLPDNNTQDDDTGMGHMQVLPIQVAVQKKAKRGADVVEKPPDLAEEARKKVDVFKKKACQTVRTHVRLVVEEDNTTNMAKALSATSFPEWRGEVDADTRQVTKLVAVYFDSKVCGEAGTQPALRLPPLREGRHNKLFGAAISLRMEGESGMRQGDGILFSDGGRDGLHSSIMSALKPPTGNMTKVKLYKHVLWCEASLRNRKHRDRGACVNQMEKLVAVLPEEQSFSFHQRVHYEGSNRGDVIYPVQAPNWDDPAETWRMTLASKKLLYGPLNRVAVGQKNVPEEVSDKQGRRRDADEEPVAYHAFPLKAVEEVFSEFNISHMLDLTCCDGKTAFVAITKRVPFVGVAFNEDHAKMLLKRLEALVFKAMQTADSPLYEPGLQALLRTAKAKAKAKAKAGQRKKTGDQEDDEEEDAQEEDEEDPEDNEDQEEDEEDQDNMEDEEEEEDNDEQDEGEDKDEQDEDQDEDEQDAEAETGGRGKKRKAQGKAKAKAKARGKAKAKPKAGGKKKQAGKAKAKARGRPKGGSKTAADVLNRLSGLM